MVYNIEYMSADVTHECKELRKILYNPETTDEEFDAAVKRFHELVIKLQDHYNTEIEYYANKCNDSTTDKESREWYTIMKAYGTLEEFVYYQTGGSETPYGINFGNITSYAKSYFNNVNELFDGSDDPAVWHACENIVNGFKGMLFLEWHDKRIWYDKSSMGFHSFRVFSSKWNEFRKLGSSEDYIRRYQS